jgi:N-acetylmuramoyl-L-alanine amidase
MPAVLVEMGFLTHPEESRLLARDHYQRTLAVAIADALALYRDRMAQHEAVTVEEAGE